MKVGQAPDLEKQEEPQVYIQEPNQQVKESFFDKSRYAISMYWFMAILYCLETFVFIFYGILNTKRNLLTAVIDLLCGLFMAFYPHFLDLRRDVNPNVFRNNIASVALLFIVPTIINIVDYKF